MPSASDPIFPDGQRCEYQPLGYSVGYPADWFANEAVVPEDPALTPVEACQYFGEQPVDVMPNAGLPATAAIIFAVHPAVPPMSEGAELLSSEELTVDGQPAIVREVQGTIDGPFFGAGDRAYEYLITLDESAVLQVSTTSDALGDYETHRVVLDRMMQTLDLHAP